MKSDQPAAGNQKQGLLAIFGDWDSLMVAVKGLKNGNVKIDTLFSPVMPHDIQKAMGSKPSPVRYFTLIGGILGICSGLALASYAHLEWKIITSGKPIIAWIPFFIIAFEGCILGGVLATMLGMILKNRLLQFHPPASYNPRFSQDRFGIFISCTATELDEFTRILKGFGAEEVHAIRE
jgi:hypothetical protein